MHAPDITRDRIVCIVGGCIVNLSHGVLERFSDPGAVWIRMVPAELNEFEKVNPTVYPHERDVRVIHDFYVGTVEEIVTDFRAKLVAAWDHMTCKPSDGQPQLNLPAFGEPSMRKQTEVLERHGLNRFVVGPELIADRNDLNEREERRNKLDKVETNQDAWTRWELMRIVAQFNGRYHSDNTSTSNCPTDNPSAVQKLIDALTVLKKDRDALDKSRED
jgi:hypothetical protein